jgi:hypothetical protein
MAKTRQIYEDIILKRRGHETDIWLNYIELERYIGRPFHYMASVKFAITI